MDANDTAKCNLIGIYKLSKSDNIIVNIYEWTMTYFII